jgi:hypothetical protein
MELLLWLTALALMAWLAWHTWVVTERWQPLGEPLLAIDHFEDGLAGWRVRSDEGSATVEDGALVLRKTTPEGLLAVDRVVPLPADQRRLRLEVVAESQDVVPGSRSWYTATVVFAGVSAEGRRDQSVPHRLVSLAGSNPPTTYAYTFHLSSQAVSGYLSIRIQRATGELRITALKLQPVETEPSFADLQIVSLVAWGLFLLAAAARFLQAAPHPGPAAAMLVVLGFGVVFDLFPASLTTPMMSALDSELVGAPSVADPVSRLMHFAGFAAVGFLLRFSRRRDPVLLQIGVMLMLAIGSELIQVVGGDLGLDDVVDAAVNVLGGLSGLAIGIWAWSRIRRRRHDAARHPTRPRLFG